MMWKEVVVAYFIIPAFPWTGSNFRQTVSQSGFEPRAFQMQVISCTVYSYAIGHILQFPPGEWVILAACKTRTATSAFCAERAPAIKRIPASDGFNCYLAALLT
jgi:hypothetical protein